MMYRINKLSFALAILLLSCVPLSAQQAKPLTSQEIVSLLYQLPRDPGMRDEIIEQIRNVESDSL